MGILRVHTTSAAISAHEGITRLLRYGMRLPFIDFRLPCGSGLDILIDPTPEMTLLFECVADLAARKVLIAAEK